LGEDLLYRRIPQFDLQGLFVALMAGIQESLLNGILGFFTDLFGSIFPQA